MKIWKSVSRSIQSACLRRRTGKWACGASLMLACLVGLALPAVGQDRSPKPSDTVVAAEKQWEYFSVDAAELVAGFDQSKIASDPPILKASFYQKKNDPRVVVSDDCEAYLLESKKRNNEYKGYRILGRKTRGQAVTGMLFKLARHPDHPSETVLAKLDFSVAGNVSGTVDAKDFHRAKGEHFQRLWSSEYAGAAMFRNLAIASMKKAGEKAQAVGPSWPLRRDQGVDATINMMSGGRAISENLSLDTELDDPDNYRGELIELADVRGVTVDAIDWSDQLSDQPTELDPLAKLVREDQYAVFLPSFQLLSEMVGRGSELARPLVHWFEPQSRVTDVLGMYQRQLGLPLNGLTRQFGGALVGEVAVTGSDPYFRTGTDIAVLMQSGQPELLHQSIVALVSGQSALHQDVKQIDHKVDGQVFTQWSNPSRKFCSFVAVTDHTVVVTNSLRQMLSVLKCARGDAESMHDLDEYKFFRQRYPRNTKNQKALVVITDGAIRRWCGPQWRISASRRTRARATIAEVTMQNADALVGGQIQSETVIHRDSELPLAGTVKLTSTGVRSDEYGTLDFQTPIVEMDLTRATQKEVDLYNRWRVRYERRWRRVFDPIAVEIGLQDDELTVDLTVIPIVINSEYRQWRQIVGDARLKPGAGDHHPESIASIDVAIDVNTPTFNFARMFVQSQMGGVNVDPFGWIDGSASVYFDYDEEWMRRYEARDRWAFQFEELVNDLPIGFHVPSKDSLRLTAFVVAIRSLQSQFAPNTIRWGSAKYKEFEYVTGQPIDRIFEGQEETPTLYYVTLPDGITLSGNQGVIERTIDRYIKRSAAAVRGKKDGNKKDAPKGDGNDIATLADDTEPAVVDPAKLLNPQMVMNVTGQAAEAMTQTNYRGGLLRTHKIAWSNLPILNYLRSRYPDRNPMEVYSQLFGQTLVEPTGGDYLWNEQQATYYSSHHGYHLDPQAGPILANTFGDEDSVRTTFSFQNGGIRATMNIADRE
ncbi:hypothetical protein [Planctomycetes bacterium K23_9]|uniref:Secreted protein n=1 Tax=Stieleria marina TaxID=1930275 RepID=A0A517P063_9BACT|nr:hypothetical protein K239x_47660 [Planctomycetes bacterium K23_9]